MKASRILAGVGAAAVLVGGGTAAAIGASSSAAVERGTSVAAEGQIVPAATQSTWISASKAAQIARKRVGGTVTKVERDWEHGRKIWEVELRKSRTEIDVDVDRKTGKILRIKREYDD